MTSPCLTLRNVSRHFGGLKAVDEVDLTVQPGERRCVIGPNGAGKTTLFNVISGELRASAGTISMCGEDVTLLQPHQRAVRGLARTFQITRLFPQLTVIDNALLACEAQDARRFAMLRPMSSCTDLEQRALALLARFGLEAVAHDTAKRLSYGVQRKLEVALSMAGRPRLLLLDEPMAGLSPAESESMLAILKQLDPAIAVLMIEHDMDIAFGFAERMTVLFNGRVLTDGHKDDISADPRVRQIYLGVTAHD